MAEDTTVLAHFYRASVMHADVWRRRLDATTNWAIVTTAAVITFAFGEAQAPHFVLLMAILFTLVFLLMESRRYQIYHVWELRLRALHQHFIVPALLEADDRDGDTTRRGLASLAADLGSTTPRMSLWRAAGYRVRRNYGPIFTIILLTWLLKLGLLPEPAADMGELVARAAVGPVPGLVVMGAMGVFFAACVALAAIAPSEHIVDWAEQKPPLRRIIDTGGVVATRRRARSEAEGAEGAEGAGGGPG